MMIASLVPLRLWILLLAACLTSVATSSIAWAQDDANAPPPQAPAQQAAPAEQEKPKDETPGDDKAKETDEDSEDEEVDLGAEVDRLTAQLDARRLRERQAAEKALVELGPQILPLLPSELDLPTAEMRQRLKRVKAQLENMESTTSIDATAVTVSNATTLGDALKQITRQTGVRFEGQYNADATIGVNLKKVPMWLAVDEALDQANLDVNPYGSVDNSIALTQRAPTRPSRSDTAAYSGVFRVEPISLLARRDLHNPELNGLDVTIDIGWEPRLTPIGLSLPLENVSAKLDDGAKLELQDSSETANAMPGGDAPSSQTILPFKLPAGRPNKIETLTGTIDALLPGKVEKFDFALAEGTFQPRDAGEVKVQVESVTPNGELHEVRVLVTFKNPDRALESHRGWVFDNPSYVRRADYKPTGTLDHAAAGDDEDSDDNKDAAAQISLPVGDPNRIENLGYELYRQTSDEIGIGFLFDLQGDPSKFVYRYETPTNIIRSKVEFTLHDITLP